MKYITVLKRSAIVVVSILITACMIASAVLADGSTDPVMVKDINPSTEDSAPYHLTVMGSTLFFSADEGTNGSELWKSDGTEAGTVMVKDIRPGSVDSYPSYLTVMGSTLFFGADDGTHGDELWKLEGINEYSVDISVVLQGGSRLPEGWEVPITIKFFSPGADVMHDIPIYEFHCNTTKVDSTATCQCAGVMPGTHDITAQACNCPECTEGNCTLTNVRRSVVISTPSTAVDMGILLAGDANCDGIINISDFGILAVSYMCTDGEPCYDCRADFDCNGIINISDFGLLAVNYMKVSPIDISE